MNILLSLYLPPSFSPLTSHIVLSNVACDVLDVIQMSGIHHMFLYNSWRKGSAPSGIHV